MRRKIFKTKPSTIHKFALNKIDIFLTVTNMLINLSGD